MMKGKKQMDKPTIIGLSTALTTTILTLTSIGFLATSKKPSQPTTIPPIQVDTKKVKFGPVLEAPTTTPPIKVDTEPVKVAPTANPPIKVDTGKVKFEPVKKDTPTYPHTSVVTTHMTKKEQGTTKDSSEDKQNPPKTQNSTLLFDANDLQTAIKKLKSPKKKSTRSRPKING